MQGSSDEQVSQYQKNEKCAAELVNTNQELLFQIQEKEKRTAELVIANQELIFQGQEKEKRAAELVIANQELIFQGREKEKRAAELVIANQELIFQGREKEKRAAELVIYNQELIFQCQEKEKRAAELAIANQKLIFQGQEKEKLTAELVIANQKLIFQGQEKEKRAAELVIANQELIFQGQEKEKRAAELVIANQKIDHQNQEREKRAAELVITNNEHVVRKELDRSRAEMEQIAKDLTLFIDTANAPIFGIDANGNVNEWNQKSAEITGFSADEVRGRNLVEEFITSDYRESVNQVLRKALVGKETSNYEFPLYTKNNQRVMVLLNATTRRNTKGDIVGVVGVGQDITKLDNSRAEMENNVLERTRELNTILTLSPDGFVLSNSDDKIVYINPAFLTMTGLKKDTLLEKSTTVFNESITTLFDLKKNQQTKFIGDNDSEQLIYLARPFTRTLHVNHKIMIGWEGEQEGHVLYFRDVTHETEVDRMKSEFLSTAAHELRTPLASIYGFSELLMCRNYDKKVSLEIIETIHRQSLNLKKLLDELLDLSRIEARAGKDFNITENSLEEIVKQSCIETEGAFNGRKFDLQSVVKWPILSFDTDKMRQVFTNLLSNGCKYSPEHEHVVLKTSERVNNGNKQFGVSIVNKGIGMTPQQFSHLGERFYRADDSGVKPGSGLGVALVIEIVSIHGGDVDFITAAGKGMSVTVWLPMLET